MENIINEAVLNVNSNDVKFNNKTSPMTVLGNAHLLTDLGEDNINKMEAQAFSYHTNAGITFKIVEYSGNSVVVKVVQNKHEAQNYFSQKRLIEIVHETFDRFFPSKRVLVKAIPFKESPANKVDVAWIQKRMFDTGTKLKDMADDTGIDKTMLTSLINGERPLSQPMKALFWFYFLSKQRKES